MGKYWGKIRRLSHLDVKSGSAIVLGENFYSISSKIISSTIFSQQLIQRIVYEAYAEEVHKAGHSLKEITSPKSRLDFLNSYNDVSQDEIVSKVFRHAKKLFCEVYELRNVLVHDLWFSSEKFPESLMLSSLDEESRLLFASGKLIHVTGMTSEQVYKATIRYIESVKLVNLPDLERALKDINLCNWCLMQIAFIIGESDPQKISELKKAFFIFKKISHIFPEKDRMAGSINSTSKKHHSIKI